MTVLIKPLEDTQVGAISASNTFASSEPGQLAATATNSSATASRTTSVDSTVQFIQAHYDTLFRRLAD